MKRFLSFFAGVAAACGIAALAGRRVRKAAREIEPVDLNTCARASLTALGLTGDEADKIIEGRPYRNKLDLVSQYIIPEEDYVLIKNRIGVDLGRANEGVRLAG